MAVSLSDPRAIGQQGAGVRGRSGIDPPRVAAGQRLSAKSTGTAGQPDLRPGASPGLTPSVGLPARGWRVRSPLVFVYFYLVSMNRQTHPLPGSCLRSSHLNVWFKSLEKDEQ